MLPKMNEHPSAKRLTVTAPDELSYPLADDFSAHLTGLPADGDLVIDLRYVGFMDSSGLRALLVERSRRERAGGTIALSNPPPQVDRVLSVTGVDQVVPVHPAGRPTTSPDPVPTRRSGASHSGPWRPANSRRLRR
jgi:anti-sigma B factor antagonist